MGYQLNFYLTPRDLLELEERVRKCGPIAVLDEFSLMPAPRILDSVRFSQLLEARFRLILCRSEDLQDVVLKKVQIGDQQRWQVDSERSPVVELDKCFFDGRILRPGRLYYIRSYFNDHDEKIVKSPGFLKWASSVLRRASKELYRDPGRVAYLGKEALVLTRTHEIELAGS